MSSMPLRYQISSWYQLPKCKSNNSKDLKLHVADYCNNNELRGLRITVEHPKFGELFAYIVNARGFYITPDVPDSELTTDEILKQLERFGFLIKYSRIDNMDIHQVEYLMTVQKLGFDKLRRIAVRHYDKLGVEVIDPYYVVFNSAELSMWLQYEYSPTLEQFKNALVSGHAINLTAVSEFHQFNWDWLDYVANIEDLLRDISIGGEM